MQRTVESGTGLTTITKLPWLKESGGLGRKPGGGNCWVLGRKLEGDSEASPKGTIWEKRKGESLKGPVIVGGFEGRIALNPHWGKGGWTAFSKNFLFLYEGR